MSEHDGLTADTPIFGEHSFYPGIGGAKASCVYFLDLPQHPFCVEASIEDLYCNVVSIPVNDWDNSLTPWPGPGLYPGDADFGGMAAATLALLTSTEIPRIEAEHGLKPSQRGILGYSLAGLFSLYAFTRTEMFTAVGSISGSLWYEGWLDHLACCQFYGEGRSAYLSLGKQEKTEPPFRLHSVEEATKKTATQLQRFGVDTRLEMGPGKHLDLERERLSAAFEALDEAL